MDLRVAAALPSALLTLALGACAHDEESNAKAGAKPVTTTAPLWRQAPDKPPGPHVARVAGRRTSFVLRTAVRGLREPVQVVARPGDDRLYVAERAGLVRVVEGGKVARRPFLDLRRRVRAGGELGLLTILFDGRGDRLFAMFTDRRMATRVEVYPAGPDRAYPEAASALLHVAQPYENHKGGTLLRDRRGRLLLGLGDGGSAFDPGQRAQDPRQPLGSLLRREEDRWEIVAVGLRNPWRMALDRATGVLWIGDVGQDRMEEIDAVRLPETGRLNLGWAAYEGRLPLGRKRLDRSAGRLVWPVAGYSHEEGCSVTGGLVYRGRSAPRLRGRYVYADFCSGTAWSLRAEAAEGGAPDLRRERTRIPGVVSFGEDAAGEAYAVTIDGRLARLVAPGD